MGVNEVYSLLLNELRDDRYPPAPWDRMTGADWRPKQLPTWLEQVRAALLDPTRTWWDLTYRLHTVMSVLENGWYADLQLFDSRHVEPEVYPSEVSYGTTVEPTLAPEDFEAPTVLQVPGYKQRVDIWRQYAITVMLSSEIHVRQGSAQTTHTWAPGSSRAVDLAGDLKLLIPAGAMIGHSWQVTSVTKPENELVRVFHDVQALPGSVTSALFRHEDPKIAKIFETYARWYAKSNEVEDKIAAVAFAYCLHVKHMK